MKTIVHFSKLFIILICVFHYSYNVSQERVSLSLYQDAKLLFLGDSHNNKAGTIDLLIKINMHGKQGNFGYPVYNIAYEQANLRVLFKRYSLSLGYTINQINQNIYSILNRIELTPSIGYGIIQRFWANKEFKIYKNWSLSTQITYQINSSIKIAILNQLIRRTDIKRKSNQPKIIRYSLFFGMEFSLFKTSKNRINSCLY